MKRRSFFLFPLSPVHLSALSSNDVISSAEGADQPDGDGDGDGDGRRDCITPDSGETISTSTLDTLDSLDSVIIHLMINMINILITASKPLTFR